MNRSTIFSFVFLLIIGAVGYMWYNYLEAPAGGEAERARFTKAFAEVRRLKSLELDTSLFQERFFRDLQAPVEVSQPDVPLGRENPFAPFR